MSHTVKFKLKNDLDLFIAKPEARRRDEFKALSDMLP